MDIHLNHTSLLINATITDPRIRSMLASIERLGPRPTDFAGIGRVVQGIHSSLKVVAGFMSAPSPAFIEIQEQLEESEAFLTAQLNAFGSVEPSSPLDGRRGKYPLWAVLSDIADADTTSAARLLCGVVILSAWSKQQKISEAAIQDIRNARKEEDFSTSALLVILKQISADVQDSQWPKRLRRGWGQVLVQYGNGQELPEPIYEDRVDSQILSTTLYPNIARRGGAVNDRQLSPLQRQACLEYIGTCMRRDEFVGALGYVVSSTGLTPELAKAVPLQLLATPSDWKVLLDIQSGSLKIDANIIAPNAAMPAGQNAEPSSFVICKPIPKILAVQLRRRFQDFPEARVLHDLYPGAAIPEAGSAVIPCTDEITPSWARLRLSTGTLCRDLGIDSLIACMLSGDFVHVPRSKLYYASVAPNELHAMAMRLHDSVGWSPPVPIPNKTLSFGCLVVPSLEQVQTIDRWWQESMREVLPGKNCKLNRLIEFHNRFVCLTTFRLCGMLALRGRQELPLSANIHEELDLFVSINDKGTAKIPGGLPVPISKFCAETIAAMRTHCRAMNRRLRRLGHQYTPLAHWCQAVVINADVPLLQVASSSMEMNPMGTWDALKPLPPELKIAPDYGRKITENQLRKMGLRSSDIDAVLRHTVLGQSSASALGDHTLLLWSQRVAPAMDQIAKDLFVSVITGLAKD